MSPNGICRFVHEYIVNIVLREWQTYVTSGLIPKIWLSHDILLDENKRCLARSGHRAKECALQIYTKFELINIRFTLTASLEQCDVIQWSVNLYTLKTNKQTRVYVKMLSAKRESFRNIFFYVFCKYSIKYFTRFQFPFIYLIYWINVPQYRF